MLSLSFSLTHTIFDNTRIFFTLLVFSIDSLSKRNASNKRERRKRKERGRKKSLRGIGLSRRRNALQSVSRFATRSIRRKSIRLAYSAQKKNLREEAISNIVNKNSSRPYHLFSSFYVYSACVYQKQLITTLFLFLFFIPSFFFLSFVIYYSLFLLALLFYFFFFSFVCSFPLFVNLFQQFILISIFKVAQRKNLKTRFSTSNRKHPSEDTEVA